MIPPAPDPVVVLAAPGSSLGGALRSALAGRGWAVSQGQQHRAASALAVVVVEDDAGGPWSPPGSLRPGRTIGIGSVRSAAALAALAARGAIVLDQDVPFLALLRLVEDGLRTDTPVGRRLRDATASGLWERAAEARALAELTERERVVLCGLIHGSSAAPSPGRGPAPWRPSARRSSRCCAGSASGASWPRSPPRTVPAAPPGSGRAWRHFITSDEARAALMRHSCLTAARRVTHAAARPRTPPGDPPRSAAMGTVTHPRFSRPRTRPRRAGPRRPR